ncbi:gibberellin 2-beta-dioxygenase 1-like [Aristolochia californica]|uniref:gibberellin 2-beta-dioxygenase 1-like n=1 Tax=Aristolochia californica TaxID=171875 RepID=UPI0035D56689
MVVLSRPALDQISFVKNQKQSLFSAIPVIDLSEPDAKFPLLHACEEYGFFKVINHGVPEEVMNRLEDEGAKFFSLPRSEKEKAGSADPFGYGNKKIGPNGDVGWVEYLLLKPDEKSIYQSVLDVSSGKPEKLRCAVTDYVSGVKDLACEVLELLAEGLKIQPRNIFSRLLMDEESDSLFRLNHYAPCPDFQSLEMIGFGEHTDPQIVSVLRSNDTTGLQISLKDGSWVSVPPDRNSFFILVGDSFQVLTNGRFRSVRHRVIANSFKSRLSMIYFGAPGLQEKIAPLPSLTAQGESRYKEFTWSEYKNSAYKSRLADNRLVLFEKKSLNEG